MMQQVIPIDCNNAFECITFIAIRHTRGTI